VLLYGENIANIGPVGLYTEKFNWIRQCFAVSYQKFTNELCQLWSYGPNSRNFYTI